jgi:UDP-glucose:(heptosyl)LPS alpha-1,3-glucosyltransferase
MKIAFILFSYFPYGGLQQDMLKILQACQRRKIDVTVYCMQWSGEIPSHTRVVQLQPQGFTRVAQRSCFVDQARAATVNDFDLVLGFNKMPGLDFYYAADYCFAEKAYNERNFLYRLSSRTRQYLEFENAVFGKDSDTVSLLLSPLQTTEYARHYNTPSERLLTLPAGIKEDRRHGPDSMAKRMLVRNHFSIAADELLLLQIGSSFKTKGLERSMQAYAAMPELLRKKTHFYVIGEDAPDKYMLKAEQLNIAKHFRVLKGRNDIADFLQAADLLIHPSIKESAGMVILEAIVAGLPVLATACCGYAHHIEKSQAGLVCPAPFQQDELNRLLQRMLAEEEQRQLWKAAGIAYGKNNDLYSMPEAVATLLSESASSLTY